MQKCKNAKMQKCKNAKMQILTSIWSVQHPNAGQNKQQVGLSKLCKTGFFTQKTT